MRIAEGSAPSGCPHKKREPTDVILSSSHAKKLALFGTRISSLDKIKSVNFYSISITNSTV